MSPVLLESAAALLPAEGAAGAAFRPGDVAVLVVRASWEGEGSLQFPDRERLEQAMQGQLRVLDEGSDAPAGAAALATSAGASQAGRAWRVQILLAPGEHELPEIPADLGGTAGEGTNGVTIPGPTITIETVLEQQEAAQIEQAQAMPEQLKAEITQRMAPARGPWELAPRVPWWAWLLLALALVALAAWLIRRLLKRRKQGPAAPPRPLEPAEVIARRRLRELRESALLSTGRHLEFHVALADILKEYLERRLGTDLREQTTEEIRRMLHGSLRSARHVPEIRQDVLAVLQSCDFVKFAKAQPLPSEALAQVDVVERLVTRTTEIAPSAAPGGKAAA